MTYLRTIGLATLFLAMATRASADITAFIGTNTTPSSRAAAGIAVGFSLVIVGFEFEYSSTGSDVGSNAPSLKSGMANIFLQTPVALFHVQPYLTTGAGVYQEVLGPHSDTSVGANIGGGVKIPLAGPLQLRVDYRVFKLGSNALDSPAQRIYIGANLKF
jgi:hypothetical protein